MHPDHWLARTAWVSEHHLDLPFVVPTADPEDEPELD
jgi:hypothetical protein